jgi:holo-[acyl-carrier protein] synthase
MNILGHGIDIVGTERISALLEKNDDFLFGWFTTRELETLADRKNQQPVIAGRVAAKEAVVKALGCGFDGEVSWQDVEILLNEAGAPNVHLSGGAESLAGSLGVSSVLVSISNEVGLAIASAIAIGAPTNQDG